MALILYNGQRVLTPGWYLDEHGHRVFIGEGNLAPMCTRFGVGITHWQLLQTAAAVSSEKHR